MVVARIQQSSVDRRVRVTEQEIENFPGFQRRSYAEWPGVSDWPHILIALPESASETEQEAEARLRAESVLEKLRNGADFKQVAVAESDGRQALEGGVIGWRKENELPSIAADVLALISRSKSPLRASALRQWLSYYFASGESEVGRSRSSINIAFATF